MTRAWKGLCRELLDLSQLTESEYACANLNYRLIPLGCHNSDGSFVRSRGTAEMVLASRALNQCTGNPLDIPPTGSFLIT